MPKKGKKAKVADDETKFEITPRVEIIYEDTKFVTEVEDKKVPYVGLEDLKLFDNILRLGITKVSTILELFPCHEVIGCILSTTNARGMSMYNVEDKGFASLHTAFIAKAYSLPTS